MKKTSALIGLVLLLTATASVVAYFAGSEKEAASRAGAIGFLTLLVVGTGSYLVLYTIRMKRLEIPADGLIDKEIVWAKTTRSVHYKSGKPYKFWEAVGGRLFLTSESLVFLANPMEWWVYQIKIPLREVRRADPCKIGFVPGGLRIEREDNTFELFTFGAAYDVSREWADAITVFRDGLVKEDSQQGGLSLNAESPTTAGTEPPSIDISVKVARLVPPLADKSHT